MENSKDKPKNNEVKLKKKAKEPKFLTESYMEQGQRKRPPYIFIALILFVILSFAWKGFMAERKAETPQAQVKAVIDSPIKK